MEKPALNGKYTRHIQLESNDEMEVKTWANWNGKEKIDRFSSISVMVKRRRKTKSRKENDKSIDHVTK